jgi:hypothetical protein
LNLLHCRFPGLNLKLLHNRFLGLSLKLPHNRFPGPRNLKLSSSLTEGQGKSTWEMKSMHHPGFVPLSGEQGLRRCRCTGHAQGACAHLLRTANHKEDPRRDGSGAEGSAYQAHCCLGRRAHGVWHRHSVRACRDRGCAQGDQPEILGCAPSPPVILFLASRFQEQSDI